MPLRAAVLKLLLKAAVNTQSDSVTRAGTLTPLSYPPNPFLITNLLMSMFVRVCCVCVDMEQLR